VFGRDLPAQAAHRQRLAKKMVPDGERNGRFLFGLASLGLPSRKTADAADVVLNLDRVVAAVPEHVHADVVAVDENVQAAIVLLLAREWCRDMRGPAPNDAASQRCGYRL
jgi:hypothetical protein